MEVLPPPGTACITSHQMTRDCPALVRMTAADATVDGRNATNPAASLYTEYERMANEARAILATLPRETLNDRRDLVGWRKDCGLFDFNTGKYGSPPIPELIAAPRHERLRSPMREPMVAHPLSVRVERHLRKVSALAPQRSQDEGQPRLNPRKGSNPSWATIAELPKYLAHSPRVKAETSIHHGRPTEIRSTAMTAPNCFAHGPSRRNDTPIYGAQVQCGGGSQTRFHSNPRASQSTPSHGRPHESDSRAHQQLDRFLADNRIPSMPGRYLARNGPPVVSACSISDQRHKADWTASGCHSNIASTGQDCRTTGQRDGSPWAAHGQDLTCVAPNLLHSGLPRKNDFVRMTPQGTHQLSPPNTYSVRRPGPNHVMEESVNQHLSNRATFASPYSAGQGGSNFEEYTGHSFPISGDQYEDSAMRGQMRVARNTNSNTPFTPTRQAVGHKRKQECIPTPPPS